MKYYAVRKGLNKGIYRTWEECQYNVIKFPNAEYKAFNTIEEAKLYLEGIDYPLVDEEIYSTETTLFDYDLTNENENLYKETKPVFKAYIDGSYNVKTNEYSMGAVLIDIDGKITQYNKKFSDCEFKVHRNVAGEVKGACFVLNYCLKNNIKEINIYYDYTGIEKWYNGVWKAKNDLTQKYVGFANEVKKHVLVNFIKVKSHSNNKYNNLSDRLSKDALGIK